MLYLVVSGPMAGCSSEFPPGALKPADCSELAPASAELIEDISGGTPLTDQDVLPGTVQMVLTIKDADGLHWYAPAGLSSSSIGTGETGGAEPVPYWGVWVDLACRPSAQASVHFLREVGELEPGEYPMVLVAFFVFDKEQSLAPELLLDGSVTITAATGGRASGYLQGRGGGALKSNFTQEAIGVDFTVEAMAFRDFPL